ncbi:MAG: glycosyltransferase [Caldilineaceae bacterium]
MKITLIGPVYPFRGGIAHYTTLLDQQLRKAGHQVQLLSFRRQYPAWLYKGKSDRDPSNHPLLTAEAIYLLDPFNPITWWQTVKVIRNFAADSCILQWWTSYWAPVWWVLAVFLALFTRIQIGFLCHNVLPHEERRWDRWLARSVLRLGSFWIVQSQAQQAQLESLIHKQPISIAPHPAYAMFTEAKIDRLAAKAKLGIASQSYLLLFFGMVRPYKGLDLALRALAQIVQQRSNVKLLVAGDFWGTKATYLALAEELKVLNFVQMEDRYIPDEEVALYFSAADMVMAPYRHLTGSGVMRVAESFGLPIATWQNEHRRNENGDVNDKSTTTEETKILRLVDAVLAGMEGNLQNGAVTDPDSADSWQRIVDIIERVGKDP